ncbi:MAG: curved DNA-binding protein CbpA [Crocinitomicaceae bacterium]|jgi:curved DNA-binding protein CbpA
MKIRNCSLSLLFLVLLASCGSINPTAPAIVVEENYVIPEAPVSVIKVPIKINLKPYFDATENELDKVFRGNEQTCEGVSVKYKFVRSPIKFKGTGTKLSFDVDGKYSLWLNYCAACTDLFASEPYCLTSRIYVTCGVDEPMRKIHVGYTTEIGVGKDYKLKSTTKLKTVKAKSPCKVSVFDYDATSELEKELKVVLKEVEKDIDKEISAISLKAEINEAWKILSAPTDLEGYGFLELNPQSIAMGKIRYVGDTAYFNAILNAKPTILSAKSGKPAKTLPNMYTYKDRNGFDISMDIFTNYDSLTSILTRSLSGMKIDLKGKEVIFGEVSVHGASNKQLHIKVDFSGTKSGTLYFTGTPVFEKAEQHISFPDLTFDLETESALLKGAKWMFDKKITEVLRAKASMDLKPYLATLKTELNKNLNMELDKGIFMSGQVKGIDIRFIQPTIDQLHIRIHSIGKLAIKMD